MRAHAEAVTLQRNRGPVPGIRITIECTQEQAEKHHDLDALCESAARMAWRYIAQWSAHLRRVGR